MSFKRKGMATPPLEWVKHLRPRRFEIRFNLPPSGIAYKASCRDCGAWVAHDHKS